LSSTTIRHCEERSDEAIQSRIDWCRANGPGLLRCARNDGGDEGLRERDGAVPKPKG
jgi:hypothetical protein